MPDLTLTKVAKSFGVNVVLHDLDLRVRDGELFTLLGPSGCGKSTTLWSIAGLHSPDRGTITFGDRVVFDGGRIDVAPERRNCGVVFQSYAVWPHLSVHDNVAYPLKLRKEKRSARAARVREVLELVELDHLEHRYPHELSGGQQQRVALARALARPPDLLLLDEPFSNLDAKLRERAREWLRALQQRIGVTTVFVTHDQHEDGWFRTGDLARTDEDGWYYIVDRAKELIIRGGFNVYPREVEETLLTHPGVSLCAVIGVPHKSHGQEIKAYVIPVTGSALTGEELGAWARERMAAYKYPRIIELVDSLPMTATGKILKRELS